MQLRLGLASVFGEPSYWLREDLEDEVIVNAVAVMERMGRKRG